MEVCGECGTDDRRPLRPATPIGRSGRPAHRRQPSQFADGPAVGRCRAGRPRRVAHTSTRVELSGTRSAVPVTHRTPAAAPWSDRESQPQRGGTARPSKRRLANRDVGTVAPAARTAGLRRGGRHRASSGVRADAPHEPERTPRSAYARRRPIGSPSSSSPNYHSVHRREPRERLPSANECHDEQRSRGPPTDAWPPNYHGRKSPTRPLSSSAGEASSAISITAIEM